MYKVKNLVSGKTACVPNSQNWNGYFVSIFSQGVGEPVEKGGMINGEGDTWLEYPKYVDAKRPYFNSILLEKDGKAELARKNKYPTIEDAIKTEWEKYLLRFDAEGYQFEDTNKTSQDKLLEDKQVYFRMYNCWETGINWYCLNTDKGQYPKEVFACMKLNFHAEQEEEEGNWKGWATTHNLNDVSAALAKLGWSIR
jgi:hypothetical protein